MADVNVVIKLYDEDDFNPLSIITLTVNSVSKTLYETDDGYITGTLVYAEDTPLNITVTFDPQLYENESWSVNAAEGTIERQLTLINPTESCTWTFTTYSIASCAWIVTIRPQCLGRPIILVDNNPILLIGKIDYTASGDIKCIDGVYINDGTWHVNVRSNGVGIDWTVTVTS